MECPMPNYGKYDDTFLRNFLHAKKIAIYGLSPDTSKTSYHVAEYLKNAGYTLFPIHPKADEILGFKVYPTLSSLPDTVDILNVFRKSEAIFDVVKEAFDSQKVQRIWVQLGIQNAQALEFCAQKQIPYIENLCILVEHRRLFA